MDAETGRCESAEKIFEHGWHSRNKENPGLQVIVDKDDELSGTFPHIKASAAVKERALKSYVRSCIRWTVRDALEMQDLSSRTATATATRQTIADRLKTV